MARKEFSDRHRELGLCTKCTRVPEPGFAMCSECQRKRRESLQNRVSRGKCHNCGNQASRGKGRCEACATAHKTKQKGLPEIEQQKALAAFTVFDGRCQICESTDPIGGVDNRYWNLDHDHAINTFRGILCSRCNKGLAFFQDSINNFEKAIQYLRRSTGGGNSGNSWTDNGRN